MQMLETMRSLRAHARWADARILEALRASDGRPPEALREFVHVLGADEVWLARLERRTPRMPVWPDVTMAELPALVERVHAGYDAYLAATDEDGLERIAAYTNSAGRAFENATSDVLLHVALHGQYHRGKVNLMLRRSGSTPAPTDYIAFVRGAPAATATAHSGPLHERKEGDSA